VTLSRLDMPVLQAQSQIRERQWPQIYGSTTKPTSHYLAKMKVILALTASILLAGIFFCQGQDTPNSAPKTTPETDAGVSTPSFDGDWRGPVKWVAGGGGAETNLQYKLRIVINGVTDHFKTSQSGSNQNRPLRGA
jgi:hypothetical protein